MLFCADHNRARFIRLFSVLATSSLLALALVGTPAEAKDPTACDRPASSRYCTTLVEFTVSPDTVVGGETATGTVRLSGGVSGGTVTVQITARGPVRYPSEVSVAVNGGAFGSEADFTIGTEGVSAVRSVKFYATYDGQSLSDRLTIEPDQASGQDEEQPQGPDLSIVGAYFVAIDDDCDGTPISTFGEDSWALCASIKNLGNETAGASTLFADEDWGQGYESTYQKAVGQMAPGAIRKVEVLRYNSPPAKSITYRLEADHHDDVAETNELNNKRTVSTSSGVAADKPQQDPSPPSLFAGFGGLGFGGFGLDGSGFGGFGLGMFGGFGGLLFGGFRG